jgi:MFS family permease
MPTQRNIVYVASASHYFAHFLELVVPAMTMFIAHDIGMDANAVIATGFYLYLLFGVMSLPWGYFADKHSCSLMLALASLIAGVAALVASSAPDLSTLTFALAFVGVGIAAAHPAGMALITKTSETPGRDLGTYGVWGNVGIVTAPLIGGIVSYIAGWRFSLIAAGIGSLILSYFAFQIVKHETSLGNKEQAAEVDKTGNGNLKEFLLLCIILVLVGLIYRGNMVTLPIYLEENGGELLAALQSSSLIQTLQQIVSGKGNTVQTFAASILLSIIVCGGIVGQIIGGYLADKYDLRFGYFIFIAASIPLLFAISQAEGLGLAVAACLFLLFSLGLQPIENSLIARLSPQSLRSRAYGTKFVLVFGLGSVSVWGVTACREALTTAHVFSVLASLQCILVLLFLLFFGLPRVVKKALD